MPLSLPQNNTQKQLLHDFQKLNDGPVFEVDIYNDPTLVFYQATFDMELEELKGKRSDQNPSVDVWFVNKLIKLPASDDKARFSPNDDVLEHKAKEYTYPNNEPYKHCNKFTIVSPWRGVVIAESDIDAIKQATKTYFDALKQPVLLLIMPHLDSTNMPYDKLTVSSNIQTETNLFEIINTIISKPIIFNELSSLPADFIQKLTYNSLLKNAPLLAQEMNKISFESETIINMAKRQLITIMIAMLQTHQSQSIFIEKA